MPSPSPRALARSGRPSTGLVVRPVHRPVPAGPGRPARPVARRPVARPTRPLPGRRSIRVNGKTYDRDQVVAFTVLGLVLIFLVQPVAELADTEPADVTAAAPPTPAGPAVAAMAAPTGTGCTATDPTAGTGSGACLTPAAAHTMAEVERVFGSYRSGPVLRSASCWSKPRPWNPSSDHPKGKGCDLFPDAFGRFPTGRELDNGWLVAHWVIAHQDALAVKYLIWQGRIWSDQRNNWGDPRGAPYSGGGVYDPGDATGGHYDHLHLSFER